MRLAQSAGASQFGDGVGMLAEQAAEALVLWSGVRPETHPVIAAHTVTLVLCGIDRVITASWACHDTTHSPIL